MLLSWAASVDDGLRINELVWCGFHRSVVVERAKTCENDRARKLIYNIHKKIQIEAKEKKIAHQTSI
jgi:hypothetical protein